MWAFLRNLKKILVKAKYNRLVEILIHKENLLNNLRQFQNLSCRWAIAPVLKSNAYGHGLLPVAKILDKENLPFFCVDSFFEALILKRTGIKTNILILGFSEVENILNSKIQQIAFNISSLEQLKKISNQLKHNQAFHLEIDTGMHRQGILSQEVFEAVKLIKGNKKIILEGIFSHLADADGEESGPTLKQIEIWNKQVDTFRHEFPNLKFWHLSATNGFNFFKEIKANVARVGRGLYGLACHLSKAVEGKPVLEMRSIISSIRTIEKGEGVGYNFTFVAERSMIIATVPVGYFEGVDRRLSNKGFVKIDGKFCPIVGIISMNMITVDISAIPNAREGVAVVVISQNAQDKNSIENIAQICNTISYEISIHLPEHLRRIVV